MKPTKLAQRRPAEAATGVAGAAAFLICRAVHLNDPAALGAVTVLVAAVPSAVTFAVVKYRQLYG